MRLFSAQPRIVNKSDRNRNPDRAIRDYIISLSSDRSTTFGSTIENFIQCTLESADTNPHNITRNVSNWQGKKVLMRNDKIKLIFLFTSENC